MKVVLVIFLCFAVGAACLASYSRGVEHAEQQNTRDINRLRVVTDSLMNIRDRTGSFPVPSTDTYEIGGLTVSDVSDSSVSYYAGLNGEHLLILHLSRTGRITISRR